jgi:S-adenosylmethionine synthetase
VDKEDPTKQGAGDQGMMFGYASSETPNYMPMTLDLSHKILQELAEIRREGGKISYLRPDAKAQVTMRYTEAGTPLIVDTVVISTQHDDFDEEEKMLETITRDMLLYVIPRVLEKYPEYSKLFVDGEKGTKYHINPTGKFVIGGPHGDTGLTGRKIIVDTYGGRGAHGGGAFSGKDPSKVDRSAAYAARHIAKNLVAAGLCREVLVQVSYAIGVAKPTSININTYNTSTVQMPDGKISEIVETIFDMTPYAIEKRLKLRNPIYSETASYGHMGRQPEKKTKIFMKGNQPIVKEVELFTWEKLDYVEKVKKAFKIK